MTRHVCAHIVAAAVLAATVSAALADDTYIGANANWLDPAAWSSGAPPLSTDNVFITPSVASGSNTLSLSASAFANNVILGAAGGGTAVLNLQGGTLVANALDVLSTGELTGSGTMQANIANAGSIDTTGQLTLNLSAPLNGACFNTGTLAADQFGMLALTGYGALPAFDNTGGVIAANGLLGAGFVTASVTLNNLSLTGGQFTTNAAGQLNFVSTDSLSDTSISGNALFAGSVSLQNVALAGTITQTSAVSLAGTITNNANWTDNAQITLNAPTTFTGGGVLTLNNTLITGALTYGALTIGANQTICGGGFINNVSIVNNGVIAASSAGSLQISLSGLNSGLTNAGTLTATGGGMLHLAGVNAVVANDGGTISAVGSLAPTGPASNVTISNLTISGGTLSTDATGQIHLTGSSALTNVQVNGNLFIDGNANFTNVTLAGNVTQSSSMNLMGVITNNATWIQQFGAGFGIAGNVLLTGTGSLTLNNGFLNAFGSAAALTIGPSASLLGSGTLEIGSTLPLVNDGILSANVPSASLHLYASASGNISPPSLVNAGTFSATNGAALVVSGNSPSGSYLANANGTLSATGFYGNATAFSHVDVSGFTIAGGQLVTDSVGVVNLNNVALTNATTNGNIIAVQSSLQNDTFNGTLTTTGGTTTLSGIITNNATWNVGNGGLVISPATSLLGNGTLALTGGSINGSGNSLSLVVGASQTVKGYGSIGASNPLFLNNVGTISADPAPTSNGATYGLPLAITIPAPLLNGGGSINTGTLKATAGASLQFTGAGESSFLDNTGGTILATGTAPGGWPQSSVVLTQVNITGGQILSDSNDPVTVNNSILSDLSLAANATLANYVYLRNVTLSGSLTQAAGSTVVLTGTITNNATWTQIGGASITIVGMQTIAGSGSMDLNSNVSGTASDFLVVGANQTIHGAPFIINLGGVLNNGRLFADTARFFNIASPLTNDGDLAIDFNSEMEVNAPFNAGTGTIHNNGTLALNGPVTGALNQSGVGTTLVYQNYTTTGNTLINGGSVQLNGTASTGAFAGTGNLTVTTGTAAAPGLVSDGIQLHSLTVTGAVQIRPNTASAGTSKLDQLSLAPGAALDLTTNDLIVEITDATTKPTLQNAIARGAGKSIGLFTSSPDLGLALIDNSLLATPYTTFGGLPVDPNALLITPALLGDATLDGQVDLNDLNTVLNNLGQPSATWAAGNFDGAATIDLNDLNDVLNHLGATHASSLNIQNSAFSVPNTPAPEPASLVLLALPILPALLNRRRGILGKMSYFSK